jgi:Zn-dependent M28 family amino/carboxypeptidase
MNKLFVLLFFLSVQAKAQDPLVSSMLADVSIDSLVYYASEISGEFPIVVGGNTVTISSRNKNYPGNAIAADYLQERFESFGLTTTVQTFGATGENILATQPGVIYPNQKVIICGHYDSMPANGTASPAADDDGSGTAAVLEAARVLSNYQFAYTIVYAVWDEEEYGLVGSNYYATQAENNNDSLVAVINVDAIAWDGDGDDLARVHVRNYANSVNLGNVAVNMISTYGINLQAEVNSPGATYSDHASFWNHDFTAILIIEDFDDDGNPHYHTTTDKVEFFDISYFEQIAKWAFATTATMAVPLAQSVGVPEHSSRSFKIYPNPVASELIIEATTPGQSMVSVALFDVMGKQVQVGAANSFPYTVNTGGLQEGSYLLRLMDEKGKVIFTQNVLKR